MSKQAGNLATKATSKTPAKSATTPKPVPILNAFAQAAIADLKQDEEANKAKTQQHNEIADANLANDPFAIYKDVDVDQLTDEAVNAYREGERSSRREGQMQIANILARYAQDKLQGDYNPINLYKNNKLQVGTVQGIARVIYCVAEKTMDGKKNPLPRNLEMRVRLIAPIIYHAVTQRIPLVWSDEHDALMVPAWLATSDAAMVNVFQENKQAREAFSKPVPLDGKEGRTVATLIKRIPNPAKVSRPNAVVVSKEDQKASLLKADIGNAGLSRTLSIIADLFTRSPNKPFNDEVVELLALCIEHVRTRNGADALQSAVAQVAGPKEAPKSKAAA